MRQYFMADLQQLYREQLRHFMGKATGPQLRSMEYAEALVEDFYWLKPILNSFSPTIIEVSTSQLVVQEPTSAHTLVDTLAAVAPGPEVEVDLLRAEQIQAEKLARESLFKELYSFAETHVQSTGQPLSVAGARLEISATQGGILKVSNPTEKIGNFRVVFLSPGSELKFEEISVPDNKRILVVGMEFDQVGGQYEGEEWNLLYRMLKATQIPLPDFVILASSRTDSADSIQALAHLRSVILNAGIGAILGFGSKICSSLLGQNIKLGQSHGKLFEREVVNEDTGAKKSVKLMPIFHPEFLKVNPNMKKMAWDDLQLFMADYLKGESFPRSLDS